MERRDRVIGEKQEDIIAQRQRAERRQGDQLCGAVAGEQVPDVQGFASVSSAATISSQVAISDIVDSEAMVDSCAASLNAAQPSDSTVVWKSRTWASRTVEATPPFVTMPPKIRVSIPARFSIHSRRLW